MTSSVRSPVKSLHGSVFPWHDPLGVGRNPSPRAYCGAGCGIANRTGLVLAIFTEWAGWASTTLWAPIHRTVGEGGAER